MLYRFIREIEFSSAPDPAVDSIGGMDAYPGRLKFKVGSRFFTYSDYTKT
jgi:hypothetical protein